LAFHLIKWNFSKSGYDELTAENTDYYNSDIKTSQDNLSQETLKTPLGEINHRGSDSSFFFFFVLLGSTLLNSNIDLF